MSRRSFSLFGDDSSPSVKSGANNSSNNTNHHHHHHTHNNNHNHSNNRSHTNSNGNHQAPTKAAPATAAATAAAAVAAKAHQLSSQTPNASPASAGAAASQPDNLVVFCREVRNLLRSKPNCMIPFSKFVPAYHNHYGRQCCVYQFGYTKLIELLEAIPHVVQIIGDNNNNSGNSATTTSNRYITLTHREQIKRFASDLIKVVKSQPGKRLRLSQFAQAYQQVLGRTFRVEDYGTDNINVLLAEIWEGTINIIPIRRELAGRKTKTNSDSGNDEGGEEDEEEEEEEREREGVDDEDDDYVGEEDEEEALDEADGDGEHGCGYASAALASCCSSTRNTDGRASFATCAGGRHRSARGPRNHQHHRNHPAPAPIKGPLFVNVPLPKNAALEQLVAQNQLVNKPYITEQYPDCWFEIPRRERSEREIKRTKYFVWDCIELLSKLDRSEHSVPFSKFIPAYHYYFNRQCKVSVFGFSKLIDLFESISPDVIEIVDQGAGEEKLIRLAKKHWPQRPIDCGPTEEELLELERELEDYEQMQRRRSTRMAAIF